MTVAQYPLELEDLGMAVLFYFVIDQCKRSLFATTHLVKQTHLVHLPPYVEIYLILKDSLP